MSKKRFYKRIKGKIHASCTVPGVKGAFYFTYDEVTDEPTKRKIQLRYFDESKQQEHRSVSVFKVDGGSVSCIALDMNSFMFSNDSGGYLVVLSGSWSYVSFTAFDSSTKDQLVDMYTSGATTRTITTLSPTSIQQDGLSRVRAASEGDFSLKSEEGDVIKVHKAVMVAMWPFFETMVTSEMKEAAENQVDLPVPTSTLETMVQYLYGEELDMEFGDAARLVVFAQMYDLPELLDIAVDEITQTTLDVSQAVLVWRQSFEAKNDDLKIHAAAKLEALMPNMTTFRDELKDLDKDELLTLLQDLCMVKGE